ncbi:hypothetical protein PMZ80_003038 [Knufia obscura]|uniref:non-specific serine/threonine protein kinase n=2 Tax=Knufia TaxID=430999 RepID=A0AAN8ECL5_9EURO|nr:hypothetical protein PMZ80_003038 [Knufia obscura]KAK5952374.1 hypothetical protein OHC33_006417 [Knufia fluminis]
MHAAQQPHHYDQHVPITSAPYPNSASSSQQYLQQPGSDDTRLPGHNVYAISSQQSRDSRRAHASPTSQRHYDIGNNSDDYAQGNQNITLPIHSRGQRDQYEGQPYVPPRTTSARSPGQTTSSRSARKDADVYATQNGGDYLDQPTDRSRDDTATSARSRRRDPHSPEAPQSAPSSRERGHEQPFQQQSRPEPTMAQHPGMMRENSEVINRVVVTDPVVDEERMRARIAEAQPMAPTPEARAMGLTHEPYNEETRGPQRRQDYSKSKRREIQFGDYVLGQTLGEGEFGKVKLGWKKDGSSQVAIKLIRRESVATNPTRLPKIYREISILKELHHPNIVQLHEMVETERHIGIILEYASGGELFDYILNQRYLKDPSARRLFAQLVSGVGYLHKKGIVHRDLKLENLLLDQNKNIIITDFGFANTFNEKDELSPEIEYNLGNKDFVRKYKLDRLDQHGLRRGDLMQTSCGSPCYAAPELVVSDSLYTGRKVDVWSCGVILYAMLAGYLPFDDDPANPEGDNINLLYKYITSTALTFPEYVTPHARDLLRRILVPDPRKRADLFEVARHSWLTEYHHVVAHITSSTTNIADIANSTINNGKVIEAMVQHSNTDLVAEAETATMGRSTSVRVPSSTSPRQEPPRTAHEAIGDEPRKERIPTRHTLQAEYVPPKQHTDRVAPEAMTRTTAGPQAISAIPNSNTKPLPQAPTQQQRQHATTTQSPPQQTTAAPVRPMRDMPRSTSDATGAVIANNAPSGHQYTTRPSTQGSLTSANGPTRSDLRLPSRGSYGQPVAPSVQTATAQGKVTQPRKEVRNYNISGPQYQHGAQNSIGQSMAEQAMNPPPPPPTKNQAPGHHRRSSTLSSLGEKLFGRSNSVHKKQRDDDRQKNGRKYPPTAMKNSYPAEEPQPRMSTDSKRSFSLGFRRKESQEIEHQEPEKPSGNKRMSLLQAMGIRGKPDSDSQRTYTPEQQQQQYGRPPTNDSAYGAGSVDGQQDRRNFNYSRPAQPQSQGYGHRPQQSQGDVYGSTGVYDNNSQQQFQQQHQRGNSQNQLAQYSDANVSQSRPSMSQGRNTLTKPRKFNDAYDQDTHKAGGTGAVKKVQDFFRRRRARADSEYR